jgi:carboxyl-terminal processing protease
MYTSRAFQWTLRVAAVVAALGITFVSPRRNGIDLDIDASSRAQAARKREPYDLTQLQVLNRVLLHVKDQYVEPERVVPKRMLLAALHSIERTIAPVIVRHNEGDANFTVTVHHAEQTFALNDVTTTWALAMRFRDVFGFLQRNLTDEDVKLRDVEYSAINGMLRTLDPHSVLLTPEVFEEMRMSTRGEFGGVGIVISIRDGQLTVIKPMPDTPATRAGLKKGDKIVRIADESTLNMPLQEAVNRLRGAPASKVTIDVVRPAQEGQPGWTKPKPIELVRAVIHIPSVESKMLADGVGLLRIKSFQGNTYDDMHRALKSLRKQGMKGLVIDLRDNPGGLLDQAVKIADEFLTSGTIVTTSSNDPSQRDEKYAKPDGTEPNYPLVVLVNGASASASEIVAGALKNHDRALIVGQQTFGKGSVQVLYEFPEDGSALKLTVAQYLTPGDVSIQGVGIIPDVGIDPMTVDADDMDLAVDQNYLREADLRRHLTHSQAKDAAGPSVVLRYYLPKETRTRLREANPEDLEENEQEDEFLTKFSRALLAKATRSGRREMLTDAQRVIDQMRQTEFDLAVTELKKLGVSWEAGRDEGPSKIDVVASTDKPNHEARAGDPFQLKVRATNTGSRTVYQLRATTKSDFRLFDGRELVFGKLAPGESREWTTTLGICEKKHSVVKQRQRDAGAHGCVLPKDLLDRADAIKIEFSEAHGHAPKPVELRTVVRALPRPQFAYQLQVADNVRGNGDGQLQAGEVATVYLRVKNVGKGQTYETQANLRNLSGRGIMLKDGRFQVDNILPGTERTVAFTFEVLPDFDVKQPAKLEVALTDVELREGLSEKLTMPVKPASSVTPTPAKGRLVLKSGAVVREAPDSSGKVVARASGGNVALPTQAKLKDYIRVEMEAGRPGWVLASDAIGPAGAAQGKIAYDINHMPPKVEIGPAVALVTRQSTLPIQGLAQDDQAVKDMYIFVGSRKAFYKSNRSNSGKELSFQSDVPLQGGVNYITVVARESKETSSRKTFVVRRDAPDGSLLETPKYDDDLDYGMDVEGPLHGE